MIQCLAIMTNFGAPGEFLEVTTILPTKYQYYKLLLVKKLVGVHHIHRNSWKLREQLSQNLITRGSIQRDSDHPVRCQ